MKNILRKLKHNTLFGFAAGVLFCSGIVYGINLYNSEEISYEPSDSSWEVTNVSEAINSLYNNVTELENIKNIGTATSAQILSGRTAVVKGSAITGTMIDRDAVTSILNAGEIYTIPAGYHNGSGKVTANSLASQTSGTATAANIASGKTAWVNGTKITGTAVNASSIPITWRIDVYQNNQQWITVDCYLYYNSKQILRLNGWQMARSSDYGDAEKTESKTGSETISIN